MFTAKYNQRLTRVYTVDFGSEATLESGSWQAFEDDQVVVPASNTYIPPFLVPKFKKRTMKRIYVEPGAFQQARLLEEKRQKQRKRQIHKTLNLVTGEVEELSEYNHNEAYRPYQGNTFAVGMLGGDRFLILPSDQHLTGLRIVQMKQKKMTWHGENTTWTSLKKSIGAGELLTAGFIDLDDTIQQIKVSSALDIVKEKDSIMIIGVRTELQTFLIKVQLNEDWMGVGNLVDMSIIHRFKPFTSALVEEIARPVHLTLSPYTGQQYAVIDDQGHISVFDIYSDKENCCIFEKDMLMKHETQFCEKWKACLFGPHPRTLIVATSEQVMLLDFKSDNRILERSLFKCLEDQRIFCLEGLDIRNSFHFCIATDYHIILLDTRYPHQPVVSWDHHLKEDPPRFMQLIKDIKDPNLVNIIAWPSRATSAIQLQYKYNGRLEYISSEEPPKIIPALYSRPTFIDFKSHTSIIRGKSVHIPHTGTHIENEVIKCKTTGDIKYMSILFRLLNNGTLVSQIFINSNSDEIHRSNNKRYSIPWDDTIMESHNETVKEENLERSSHLKGWHSRSFFQELIQSAVLSKLSASTPPSLDHPNLETSQFAGPITALVDPVIKKQLPLMSKHALKDLKTNIENHGYVLLKSNPELLKNQGVWDPIPGQEKINTLAKAAISNSICNKTVRKTSKQKKTRNKLETFFSRDMTSNLSYYLQPKGSQFRYLRPAKYADSDYTPSSSTFLLGWDWIPNQDEFTPPDLTRPLTNQHRPLFYQVNPTTTVPTTTSSQPIEMPPAIYSSASQPVDTFSQSASFDSIATQPMPGTFANRSKFLDPKKKMKKKRKTTSGFM